MDGAATLSDIFAASRSSKLSATELRLWLVVRSYDSGQGCFASTRTLAEQLQLSGSYVEKLRSRLVQRGWLKMTHRGPKEPRLRATVPLQAPHHSEEQALHSSEKQQEAPHHDEELEAEALHKALHHSANRVRRVRNNKHIGEILSRLARYDEAELEILDRAFFEFAGTRKSEQVSASIILGELDYYAKHPVGQVLTGLRTYLDKHCFVDGKNEKYARGIIRNTPTDARPSDFARNGRPQTPKGPEYGRLR